MAFQEWVFRYGKVPAAWEWDYTAPTVRQRIKNGDWAELERRHGTRDWPSASTVRDVFGSWNAAMEAAGFEPRPLGHYRDEAHRRLPRKAA